MKMYHTPFIKFIAYQLQVGENLTMFLQNADGAKIQSMDESIVQILNAGENGLIVNNQTSTKGIKQGSTSLKITLEATADKRKTIITLPITVQNSATKGSFNVGNSAGGTTNMQSMPRNFGILSNVNGYWSLVCKSVNGSNNEYPRMINLTPSIIKLETVSEANKQSTYRIRVGGNGLGLVALKCGDYEANLANGITPALRQITRWQVASFHILKSACKVFANDNNCLEVDEMRKIYLYD